MIRRKALLLLAATAPLGQLALAQEMWPSKPIKLVVPYPAGGLVDALARQVGRIFEKDLGQPVVIENRPGAASNIGSDYVAKAAPDGYTFLLGSSANAVNMGLYKNLPYDTLRDFAAITILADVPNVLVVSTGFPPKTVKEMISYVSERKNQVAYASSGAGSPAHLAAVAFERATGTEMRHVSYKGAPPAVADMMGGHVPLMFTNLAAVLPGLQSGKLRLLGVGSAKRWPGLPDVPAIGETVPGYVATAWYGLMAPKGTPAAVLDRLQKALAGVREPASLEAMRKLGAEPVVSTAAEMTKRLEADVREYAKLIKSAGITVD